MLKMKINNNHERERIIAYRTGLTIPLILYIKTHTRSYTHKRPCSHNPCAHNDPTHTHTAHMYHPPPSQNAHNAHTSRPYTHNVQAITPIRTQLMCISLPPPIRATPTHAATQPLLSQLVRHLAIRGDEILTSYCTATPFTQKIGEYNGC